MNKHSPPVRYTRSLIAVALIGFVTAVAPAIAFVGKPTIKAVPEKLIPAVADQNTNLATVNAFAQLKITAPDAALLAIIPANEQHAITPKVTATTSNNTAIAANTVNTATLRLKEAANAPNGASQTVTFVAFIADAANTDAWAADPPAVSASG